ncbi:hypothetical protein GK611_001891 [Neisseria gonorrhoeae]
MQQTSTPTADPSSLPVGESWREGNKPQGLYLGGEGIRKDCHHSENALSPALPHGGREWVSADFSVAGDLKGNLDLQLLFQVV